MNDVRRVRPMKSKLAYGWIEDPSGTHALMPWSQHINREMLLTKALDENKRMSAEIERLLDEIERLLEERDQAARDAGEYMAKEAQRDREVLDLRAENERLRKVFSAARWVTRNQRILEKAISELEENNV
jgi:HAMP domain-containing protein